MQLQVTQVPAPPELLGALAASVVKRIQLCFLPPTRRRKLDKFLIGAVAPSEPLMFYEGALDDPFYEELKKRAAKYFRDSKQHPRFSWTM